MDSNSPTLALLGPLLAASLHIIILQRVEIDHLVLPGIVATCVGYGTLAYYIHLGPATLLATSFWISLWVWIGVYRAFFHSLRNYPGPFAAKISKWWTVKQTWDTDLHFHQTQQQLQKEYGDYVRTGPRELTIFDVDAIPNILGFQSKTSKGPWFDMMEKSLHVNRDKPFHRQRRKVWDNAFKSTLSDYAPMVEKFTEQLLQRFRKEEGKPIPLVEYMTYYSHDVMSELAFGHSMGFVKGEQNEAAQSILNTMTGSLTMIGFLSHVPWIMQALGLLTSRVGPMKEWTDWSVNHMKTRMAIKDAKPDLVSHLIANTSNDPAGRALLYGESRLIIAAGGETTSSALTFIFMHLATKPKYMHALRKELREHASSYHCQRSLSLLDAIINESMRVSPSVFFATQRVTPPEGIKIKEHFIPGNMIVQIPHFALYHDPRNFVRPDEFLPERWLDQPELVLRKDAFFPFLVGPYSCAGKALAMMELRSVISRVISEFDVKVPEGFDGQRYFDGIKDHVTAEGPEADVTFVKAEG